MTSQYHNLRNEKLLLQRDSSISPTEKHQRITEIDRNLEALGGTDRYQQASIISTSHFKTSRWVISTLESKLNMKPDAKDKKLNAFEVGAINIQLQQCTWLRVRAIDVNSQHPLIEERDFFSVEPEGNYDVVVCSMVGHINTFLHDS